MCLFLGLTVQAQSVTFTSNGTFYVPAGVTSVQVDAWGGGGAGGGTDWSGAISRTYLGGGGGGGGYTKATDVPVTPGGTVEVAVGNGGIGGQYAVGGNGGFSAFGTVYASGGRGGGRSGGTGGGGSGGAGGSGTFYGGNGGTANGVASGGGGGGAGNAAPGGHGSNAVSGAGGIALGGDGGYGSGGNANGSPAVGLAGGGGGSRSTGAFTASYAGGNGYRGQVIVSYVCPSYELGNSTATTPLCGASAATVMIYSSTMPSGNYQLTYSISGATTVANQVTIVSFSQGTPGSGIFYTVPLAIGTSTITISSIASENCSTIQTINNSSVVNVLPASTVVAGPSFALCETTPSVNITSGASATNYNSILWTTSGSGVISNPNSLTLASYAPSPADFIAGSVTFTITTTGAAACSTVVASKVLTFVKAPVAVAGGNQTICPNQTATVSGASSANGTISWTHNGAGSITAGATTLTPTYTPGAADAGAVVTMTLRVANASCATATAVYTINVSGFPAASAGLLVKLCSNSGAVNITAGAAASNYSGINWTSNGTGTINNPTSLTLATYTPGPGESGSVTLTLTAFGNGSCVAATATKLITISAIPITTGNAVYQGAPAYLTASACPSPIYPTEATYASTSINAGDGVWWSNPQFAQNDDNNHAAWSVSSNDFGNVTATSRSLLLSNYNFNIPADATILGITVRIARFQTGSLGNAYDQTLYLVKNGGVVSTNKALPSDAWPTSKTYKNYGSSADLWGTTWTPAEINSGQFGVALSTLQSVYLFGTTTASVDAIDVIVHYQIPATLRWYTASSGGTAIGTGSVFNPVGVPGSPLMNNDTPGTTTFYAECAAVQECRIPATYTINALCAPVGVPYVQNFNAAVSPSIPACTTIQNVGLGNDWATSSAIPSGFPTNALFYRWNANHTANAWFYTQGILLTAGSQYDVAYKYGNNSAGHVEKLSVAVGNYPASGAMNTILANHTAITGGAPTTNHVVFTAPSTGVYYFGFHAYSAANQYLLFVDDIVITQTGLPSITSIGTSSGCNGDSIVINGTNLMAATAADIKVGGVPVAAVTSNTGTEIVAVVSSGSGAVTVTTNLGTATGPIYTVNQLPVITTQPIIPLPVCANATTTVSVTANGAASYQWTRNNVPLTDDAIFTGTTTSTLTITNPPVSESGAAFRAIVTSASGCTQLSDAAILRVKVVTAADAASNSPVCQSGTINLSTTQVASQGYTMNGNSGVSFIDIRNTGTNVQGPLADDSEHNITIPAFVFNGISYTNARVGMNGVIVLGSTSGEIFHQNIALPNLNHSAGSVVIAPFWDDLDVQSTPTIKTQTVGSLFIIQYTNAGHDLIGSATNSITFQVQLNLSTGAITFAYQDVQFGISTYDSGKSATIGIQTSATSAVMYSNGVASLSNGQSITFNPDVLTYSWTGPNSFTSNLPNPSITNATSAASGAYTLTIFNSSGCLSTATTNVVVNPDVVYYADADNDSFGNPNVTLTSCSAAPAGYVANNTDCNDADAAIHTNFSFYLDADGDAYGTGNLISVCAIDANTPPVGYATNNLDCNDNIAAIHPNAAEIPYNGVDDNCNGIIDENGTVTTTLLPTSCGSTLASIGSIIGITTVVGHPITGYRIRVTSGSEVQQIERNVPNFTMTQFASYHYATTYTVEIQLQRAGVWLDSWGAPCLISTPAILEQGGSGSVNPSQCGITLAQINTLISTTSLPGVTAYRFRITDLTTPTGPNVVQTIDRTQNWFSLPMLARFNYGTLYRVEVAVKTTGGYGGFGSPCELNSPAVPSLVNCGGSVLLKTTAVSTNSVAGVSQYRFQIVRASDNATSTVDRGVNWFNFNMVPASAYTIGGLYYVRVAVMTSGSWSPYGDACEITAPGGTGKGVATDEHPSQLQSEMFKAIAYPSPFTAEFSISITTSTSENVQLKVYDMLGKLIESRPVRLLDMNTEKIGLHYPSGVYNIVISQNGIVRTLRVIKR